MSRSYPIWNKVTACIYNSNKSYGAKDDSNCEILVGSSSGNSHTMAKIRTTRSVMGDEIHFKLSVNDMIIKTMIFENKNGRAGELLNEHDILK